MTQQLGYVEEISRAAAKIENPLGTSQIEFDLANSSNIDSDPPVEIKIFRPVCAGICDRVSLANLLESNRVDCFDNPCFIERESTSSEKSGRMFPRATQTTAVYKLTDVS